MGERLLGQDPFHLSLDAPSLQLSKLATVPWRGDQALPEGMSPQPGLDEGQMKQPGNTSCFTDYKRVLSCQLWDGIHHPQGLGPLPKHRCPISAWPAAAGPQVFLVPSSRPNTMCHCPFRAGHWQPRDVQVLLSLLLHWAFGGEILCPLTGCRWALTGETAFVAKRTELPTTFQYWQFIH